MPAYIYHSSEIRDRFYQLNLKTHVMMSHAVTPHEFWLKYTVSPSTPMGREQREADMGRAVVFFVSEDAKNVSSQVLHADGGLVMR